MRNRSDAGVNLQNVDREAAGSELTDREAEAVRGGGEWTAWITDEHCGVKAPAAGKLMVRRAIDDDPMGLIDTSTGEIAWADE